MITLILSLLVLCLLPGQTVTERSVKVRLSSTHAWLIEALFGREVLLICYPFRYNRVYVRAQVCRPGFSSRLDRAGREQFAWTF